MLYYPHKIQQGEKKMKRFWKYFSLIILSLLCLGLFACGESNGVGASNGVGDYKDAESSTVLPDSLNRKIVYNARICLETDEVSATQQALDEKCLALGGYVESNSQNYDDGECTYVYVVYRIPTEKLNDFLASAEQGGDVIYKSVSSSDITTSYVNASAKKEALQEQKTLYQDMLNDSTISASDRVLIIKEIAEIDTQLKEIDLMLTKYDSMVGYSTVRITIEQKTISPIVPVIIVLSVFTVAGIFSSIFFPLYFTKHSKKKTE